MLKNKDFIVKIYDKICINKLTITQFKCIVYSEKEDIMGFIEYKTLSVQCENCEGTGITKKRMGSFLTTTFLPPGVGDICNPCNGSGKAEKAYTPFTGRKEITGIHTVGRTPWYNDDRDIKRTISYKEFLEGKLP